MSNDGDNARKKAKTDAAVARRGRPLAAAPSALEDLMQNEDVWRSTFSGLVGPVGLIGLMHVSRATRRIAAPALNALEAEAHIACRAKMFRLFLRCPRVTKGNEVWGELKNTSEAIPGPLRLDVIADNASDIEKRFVVLRYQKDYDTEMSVVALFDENGAYVGNYGFGSEQFYEDYATKDVMTGGGRCFNSRGGSNTSMPDFVLSSSTGSSPTRTLDLLSNGVNNDMKWRTPLRAQTEYYWQEGWLGNVLFPHVALIDTFAGTLSPTEAMFVLMHALSSDTRSIYVMTVSFWDSLYYDFCYFSEEGYWEEDEEEEESRWKASIEELKQKLLQISYDE
ncbi:hypothetical protein ACHAXT_011832 [Thalassiosira profunda]